MLPGAAGRTRPTLSAGRRLAPRPGIRGQSLPGAERDHFVEAVVSDLPAAGRAICTDSWAPPCATHGLLSADASDPEPQIARSHLTLYDTSRIDQAEAEVPHSEFLERHREFLTTFVPIAGLVAVTANSLIGYDTDHGFRIHHEGWFGAHTTNGGADKASHLTDYFVVASVLEDAYRVLGHSE